MFYFQSAIIPELRLVNSRDGLQLTFRDAGGFGSTGLGDNHK